ncbi:MAG: alpha/beta fold hydrolase [Planctomycetota bacterium]|jgi:pimeloyl-ACP methyl ester carboxylesterase
MEMMLDHGPLSFQEKGSGRPYILLNGLPFGADEFDDVLEPLSWSARAIAVNLPGIGGSAPIKDPTPRAISEILLFAFAKLGLDCMVIGATDVAGPVVYEILRAQPGLVGGILLYNTCIQRAGLRLPQYLERPKTTVINLLQPTRRLENEIVCAMGKGENLKPATLEVGLTNLNRAARRQGAALFDSLYRCPFGSYREELMRFRKPTRILWGSRSPLFGVTQFETLKKLIPEAPARSEVNIGHFFGLEDPSILTHELQELGREVWN